MLFFLPIVYFLVYELPASARSCGPDAAVIVRKVAILTALSWSAYPVVWILGEGASMISADAEAIAYCFLDVTAKSVFGYLIIMARNGIDQALGSNGEGGMGTQLLNDGGAEMGVVGQATKKDAV